MPEPPSWAHPSSQLPVSQPEKALCAPHTHSATRTLSLEAADTRRASHQAIHDLDEQKPETQAVSGLDLVGLDRRGSSVHSRGKGRKPRLADGPSGTQMPHGGMQGSLVAWGWDHIALGQRGGHTYTPQPGGDDHDKCDVPLNPCTSLSS